MRGPALLVILVLCIAALGLAFTDRRGLLGEGKNVHVRTKCMNVKDSHVQGTWRNVDVDRYATARDLNRGDVVVLEPSAGRRSHPSTRVLGLPGDTITVEGSEVFVNGEKVRHDAIPHSTSVMESVGKHRYKVTYRGPVESRHAELGPDEVFVLPDHRADDYCQEASGTLPFDRILGAY